MVWVLGISRLLPKVNFLVWRIISCGTRMRGGDSCEEFNDVRLNAVTHPVSNTYRRSLCSTTVREGVQEQSCQIITAAHLDFIAETL